MPAKESGLGAEAAEYLRAYLKEAEGDDAQFRDIDAQVIPLSSGRPESPPRQRPEDVLGVSAGGMNVDWVLSRLQPFWLGIKPGRFSACRARLVNSLKNPEIVRFY